MFVKDTNRKEQMNPDEVKKVVEEVLNKDELVIDTRSDADVFGQCKEALTQAIPDKLWVARSEDEIANVIECAVYDFDVDGEESNANKFAAKALVKFMRGDK